MKIVGLVLAILWFAAPVHAEDIASYEMEGDADAAGTDARTAAVDEAFGRAIRAAIGELVDNDVRKANKAVLDKEIVGRARLWVASFSVTKDETADGRRQLTVLARVDRDKLRARLGELNIATVAATGDVAKPGTKSVVVLMRVTSPEGMRASFGAGATQELPGMGAFAASLRAAGMATKRAPASAPAAKPGELPLEDDEADAVAAAAKTELVALAGVTVGEPVAVRGIAASGVLVTAHVKLRAGGKTTGQGTAMVAARGAEATVVASAVERALVAAAGDVMPAARPTLDAPRPQISGDDTPVAQDGVVLVRMSPKTPWGLVVAEQKYLQGAKGVQRAVIRRLSPGGWVIGVTTTESLERIAAIAKKAPATDTSVKVKIVGNIVEVALSGSP